MTTVTLTIDDAYAAKPAIAKINEARMAQEVRFELFPQTQGRSILKNDRFIKVLKALNTENSAIEHISFSNMFVLRPSEVNALMEALHVFLEQQKGVQVLLLFKLDNSLAWGDMKGKPCILQLPSWVEDCPRICVRTSYDLPRKLGMLVQPALHLNCVSSLELKLEGDRTWIIAILSRMFMGPNEDFIQAKEVKVVFRARPTGVPLKIISKCNQAKIKHITTEALGKTWMGRGLATYFSKQLDSERETCLIVRGYYTYHRVKALEQGRGFLVKELHEDNLGRESMRLLVSVMKCLPHYA